MQLQRRYNLPNCTLLVDGLAETTGEVGYSQRLSVLMNLDCYVSGESEPLSGGIDFLKSLMSAVSHYAQQCLSGVPHPQSQATPSPVQIRALAPDQHELQIYDSAEQSPPSELSRRITLNTVQLFDLVEALDQLLADPLTLPQLTLPLNPLTREDVADRLPVIQRAAAPTLGLASLATAATLFFFAPIPEIQRPLVDPLPGQEVSSGESETTRTGETPAPEAEPEASNVPIQTRETLLALNTKLFDQIDTGWADPPTYTENLTYRVSLNADGQIRGYSPNDDRSARYEQNTPLPKLLTVAPEGSEENLIDFKVVLTPQGRVEVNPWHGLPPEPIETPASSTTPETGSLETGNPNTGNPNTGNGGAITDPDTLKTINETLRNQLDSQWTISPSFGTPVVFRFAVDETGRILNFEPVSANASRYITELGFASLKVSDPEPSTSSAEFRAVFTPKGVIEVSPWDGF